MSAVVHYEVDAIPNRERKNRVQEILKRAGEFVPLDDAMIERGEELRSVGLKTYDALHVACAEGAHVDVLLTTDDLLLRAASRHAQQLQVRVENPLIWLQEVA